MMDEPSGSSRPRRLAGRTASSTSRSGPRTLDEFVGQDRVKEQLALLIEGARAAASPSTTSCSAGRPASARPRSAQIVANEMGAGFQPTSGPALDRPSDLAAILTNLEDGDVLFVDEIHRMPRTVEEVLYPALEDFNLDVVLGKGPTARSIRLELPRFTLVGATTRPGRITLPLRERFGFSPRLDYYSVDELGRIVRRSAGILAVQIDADGADEIARRSRGTPRIANRLLRRVRDFAEVRHDGVDHRATSRAPGSRCSRSTSRVWTGSTTTILATVVEKFGGGPVGLSTLAAAVGEETDTIEDVVEPYLLQLGFLKRTPRGRVATERAYRHLGIARRARCPSSGGAASFLPVGAVDSGPDRSVPSPIRPHGRLDAMIALDRSDVHQSSNPLALFLPLLLMGGVFYFLLIRPQQKRAARPAALVNASRSATRS